MEGNTIIPDEVMESGAPTTVLTALLFTIETYFFKLLTKELRV
jgi:hypothetical protein